MPLVRIDLRAGKPAEYVRAIGAAVQRAMVEALDVPPRDQFQVINEHPSVTGQQVNDALKNLGHAMSNITDAFTSLIRRKPQLAMQVEKTGSSKQARKKYKLTIAGINEVKKLLTPEEEG